MHRILTFFLGLYWLVQFTLLALAAGGGASGPLNGGQSGFLSHPPTDGHATSMALAFGAGMVAVLFLWLLATVLLADDSTENEVEEVARLAFAGATGVLTLCLVMGAGDPTVAFSTVIPLQLGALLASYVAVCLERRIGPQSGVDPEDDLAASARSMALAAAHNSLLSRFSRRPGPGEAQ